MPADKMPVQRLNEEQFIYGSGWSAAVAAAGATANLTINILADADFKCYYFTTAVRQGVAGAEVLVANWAGTINVFYAQSGKTVSDTPIPVDAVVGFGRDPYVLPRPRIFEANTTVTIQVTSNVGTRTQVFFCMHGAKLRA